MFCNRSIFKSSHSLILLALWIRCRTICQDYTKLLQNLFFKILGLLPKFLLSFILPSCQSTLDGCKKRLKYAKKRQIHKNTNTQIHKYTYASLSFILPSLSISQSTLDGSNSWLYSKETKRQEKNNETNESETEKNKLTKRNIFHNNCGRPIFHHRGQARLFKTRVIYF